MNCPKCGSSETHDHNSCYPNMALHLCVNCQTYWTDWQQAEIESLQEIIVKTKLMFPSETTAVAIASEAINKTNQTEKGE